MRARLLCATALAGLALTRPALAQPAPGTGPQGGRVVAGQAAITTAPGRTTITQGSDRAAIDWQRFDVGRDHTVQFRQPSAQSWTLNRVQAGDPSTIAGRIQANGGVVITNPSGVVFSQGAQVNVGSLIASAPGITNEAFMAGRMRFDQPARPGARVSNAGEITVAQGGLAALVAPEVANSGRIRARLGRVVMGGAEAYALDLQGDGLISFDVTEQVRSHGGAPALVTNSGEIEAQGGTVLLAARAAGGVIETLVSQAGSVEVGPGRATLRAEGGDVAVSGRIGATGGASGRGGTVAVVASGTARLAPSARIDASGGAGGGRVVVGAGAASRPGAAVGLGGGVAMAAGAQIRADATQRGSGGTVVLHSADRTEALGRISARGAGGGDGGQVEVSSRGQLLMGAVVDLVAPGGQAGRLLVDPSVVHVVATFTGGTISEVLASTIETTAGDYRLEAQDTIRVLAPIDKRGGGLTLATTGAALVTDSGIFVNADITLRDPAARFDASTPGLFALRGDAAIAAPGITVAAGGIAVTGSMTASLAAIGLTASGAVTDTRVLNGGISITGRLSADNISLVSGNSFIHIGTAALTGDEIAAMPSALGLDDPDLLRGTPFLLRASLRTLGGVGAIDLTAAREVYVSGQIAAGNSARGASVGLRAGTDMTLGGNIDAYGQLVATAGGAIRHGGQSRSFNVAGSTLPFGITMTADAGLVNTGLIASRQASTSLAVADLPGVSLTALSGAVQAGTIDSGGRLLVSGNGVRLDGPITGGLGLSNGGDVQVLGNAGSISVEVPLTVPGAAGSFAAVTDKAFHLAGFGDGRGISANTITIDAGGIALAGSLSAGLPDPGHAGTGAIRLTATGALGDAAALHGSLTLLNTIQAGGATPISLTSRNGFILVAPAAQATDLLAGLGGPSREQVLRGNACTTLTCAGIDSKSSGAVRLDAGLHGVNAGVITAAATISLQATGDLRNSNLIEALGGPTPPGSAPVLALRAGGQITNTGTLRGSGGSAHPTATATTVRTEALLLQADGSILQGLGGRIEALAGATPAEGVGRLAFSAGGDVTNDGVLMAEGGMTLFAGGSITNSRSGQIRATPIDLNGTETHRLHLQARGNLTNAGLIEATAASPSPATDILATISGDITNTGSLLTPTLLRLVAGNAVSLDGSLSATQLEVLGASLRLDTAVLTLSESGWFSAPRITAGGPSRLGSSPLRPALVFDVRAGGRPGTALADLADDSDVTQPTQLAGFGAPGAGPGGLVTLNLEAASAPVFLLLDDGVADGRLLARRLGVQGSGGAATLTGAVSGNAGPSAARRVALSPQGDDDAQARYLFNGCVMALASCRPIAVPAPGPAPVAIGGGEGAGVVVALVADSPPGILPAAALLTEGLELRQQATPAILLAGTLTEAELRSVPLRNAPGAFLPQPGIVALRTPRVRLADPDLVLPLGLAEEE